MVHSEIKEAKKTAPKYGCFLQNQTIFSVFCGKLVESLSTITYS
jgi:hypothetical protein